jgi:hypothetical protein
MTLLKFLMNSGLYVVCLAFGGVDAAVDDADRLARALMGGDRITAEWVRAWKDRVPTDCACVSHRRTPVATTGAND